VSAAVYRWVALRFCLAERCTFYLWCMPVEVSLRLCQADVHSPFAESSYPREGFCVWVLERGADPALQHCRELVQAHCGWEDPWREFVQ
jgi:hypothetical protein